MKVTVRIILLLGIIVLGFMIAFPQWSDFLVTERSKRIEQRQFEEMSKPPEAPKDWHIKLNGSITDNTVYKIIVTYSAKKQKRSCQHYNPFSSSYLQDVEFKHYLPTISNGQHSITIPLNEFNPKKGCQFEVENVALEVFPENEDSAGNSNSLFIKKYVANAVQSNILNIECAEYSGRNKNRRSVGCYQNIEKSIPIEQRLSLSNESWTININRLDTTEYSKKVDRHYQQIAVTRELEQLCKLIHSFDELNDFNPSMPNEVMDDLKGNKVLRGEFGEFNNTEQPPSFKVYLSRLNATYRNLTKSIQQNSEQLFVDPWARPYIYKRSEDKKSFSIYSKGQDESDDSDDIHSQCKG